MRIIVFLICFSTSLLGFSQEPLEVPVNYFSPPVDIAIFLSGNFGEMRSNHFHTGIDIKTQGRIGLPILAVDDGWVSRIRVSLSGYGNAVYIDHPNGFTSVYAHLDKFNDKIEAFLENAQYDLEEYVVDLYPGKGKIQVLRGEEIAKSGNTGHSGGPHLHFELRETESEIPVNPLLFGFKIKDTTPPKAYSVMAIPLDETSVIRGQEIKDIANGKLNAPFRVSGQVGFAIKTYDFYDGSSNFCGTYRVKLYRDDKLVYSHVLDRLDFYTNRFVNAHLVYDYFKQTKSRFQRSYKLPYNELPIYEIVLDKKQWNHEADSVYSYKYVLEDYDGNITEVKFAVQGISSQADQVKTGSKFAYNQPNEFRSEKCVVYIPVGRLYDDMYFECEEVSPIPNTIAPAFAIGNIEVPLQEKIVVKIKVDIKDSLLRDNAVVVNYDKTKDRITAIGGKYRLGWVEAKTKSFGTYSVMLDTIAPRISAMNFKPKMHGKKTMSFKITDDLSGIQSYNIFIDGQWVLGEYFPQASKLVHRFDESRLVKGKHTVLVVVTDERGNEGVFTKEFVN